MKPTAFWPPWFLMRSRLLILWLSFTVCDRSLLSHWFHDSPFVSHYSDDCDPTWASLSLSYLNFIELLGYVGQCCSSYFFTGSFCPFLTSLSGTPVKHMWVCPVVSHSSLRFCSFFCIRFSSAKIAVFQSTYL